MRKIALSVVLSACFFGTQLFAEEPAEKPGKWRPWQTHAPHQDVYKCATKQELAVVEGHLKKLRGLWEKVPAIANPVGYEVRAEMHEFIDYCLYLAPNAKGGGYSHRYDNTRPIQSEISFFPFNYIKIKGKIVANDETAALYFRGNNIPEGPSLPFLDRVFLEPVQLNDRFGVPAYGFCNAPGNCSKDDDLLMVRNNERPLWKPASLLNIYDQFLKKARDDVSAFENEAEKSKRTYAEYITPKAQSLRAAKHRQFAPAMSRNLKKTESEVIVWQEDLARKTEEHYRRNAEEAIPSPGSVWASRLADVERITSLRQQFLNTKPGAAAYLCGRPSGSGQQMGRYTDAALYRSEGGLECRAVVEVNPAYFNAKLPKTAIQLLTVKSYNRCLTSPPPKGPGGCAEDLKLLQGLDWNTVRTIMDR